MEHRHTDPSETDPLKNVIFISLPEEIARTFAETTGPAGKALLDPAALLPVETAGTPDTWNPDELSWEMIMAGMLKVLAYQPDHEDTPLYRDFLGEVRPRLVEELAETGIINARNENFALAEEIFRALSGLVPDGIEGPVNLALTLEQRAEALQKIGKNNDAESCRTRACAIYQDLLSRDTELPPSVHLNAGLFFLRLYRMEEAKRRLEYFLEYSQAKDDDEDGDQEEETIARVRKILAEIDSQSTTDRHFREAFECIKSGREEEGLHHVTEFLKAHPQAWNGWFLLGWGRRRLSRFTEAAEAFEQARSLGGDTADTLNELAICRMELGDFAESRRLLIEALTREPDNTKIMSNLGVLALKEENIPEARRYFATVLELEPEDPVALQYQALLG
ncbi:hypothetical protein AU468_04680 [Alkalispirochaeta sphaeroplastigenens]|uniref:Cytochrome c-type biogenesis protein H TPR domain-containing protein n=1 Tax=Alkalispirochaeta sphaeroplastigenens TaxID=1187066 RepID=A0A2S4JWQ6_9SPIO|nr:tetratricopeptide repeat protein [Alkalispirochaeta sphaeroplastigenens]POR03965.1 hypothetical protein AU468_04680 [Alkalispirochaeta sphaeroplastigenens]